MAVISSPGLGSGLDVNSIVPALVAAETEGNEFRLAQKEASTLSTFSAIGSIKSALTTFRSSLAGVSSLSSFQSRTTNSSDTDVLTATSDETVATGNYDVIVTALAKAHSLSSAAFAATTTSVGSGDLIISIGDYTTFTSTTISIDSEADTLADIKQAINDSDAGVTASIINDGTGYKLSVVSNETGLDNQIKITVSDDSDAVNNDNSGLSQLAYDKTLTAPESNLTQNIAALDSALTINGISITSSSRTLIDNIDGLTLNLKEIGSSTISIGSNSSGAKTSINSFVDNYNDVIGLLNQLGAYDPETGVGGPLQGQSVVRIIQSQLKDIIYSPIENITGPYKYITDLGITTNADNTLTVNSSKLSTALTDNFEEVGQVFARGAYATDSLLQVESQGASVAAGVYQVSIDSGTFGSPGPLNGTIGGIEATATDGVLLEGSLAFSTLSIDVKGGSFGNRGQVIVFDGLSKKIDDLLGSFINSDGSITSQLDAYSTELEAFAVKKTELAQEKQEIEERYFKQFSQIDVLMNQLQSTSSFLTTAFSSLPGVYKKDKG